MARGENIFKRKDGRWEGRYIKERDENNKIKYGFCYGHSYHEAKEKVQIARLGLNKMNSKEDHILQNQKFAVFCDRWLESKRIKWKASTYSKYQCILKRHIKPILGNYFINQINSELIQKISMEFSKNSPLSPKTIRDILTLLKQILAELIKNTKLDLVLESITYPRNEKKAIRVFSREEHLRFVNYLGQDMDIYKFAILLTLNTGLRVGEVCALRWEDISKTDSVLNVKRTVQRIQNTNTDSPQKTVLYIGKPKTAHSIRTIPLSKKLFTLLHQFQHENPADYILTGSAMPLDPRNMQRKLKKYTDACSISDVHFHTLRHTFATRCVEVGCDIKTLSEILGHSSITVTMNRYVHPSIDFKRQNILKLEQAGFGCAVS